MVTRVNTDADDMRAPALSGQPPHSVFRFGVRRSWPGPCIAAQLLTVSMTGQSRDRGKVSSSRTFTTISLAGANGILAC